MRPNPRLRKCRMRQISRRHLAEQLEPRLLLAGDDPLVGPGASPSALHSNPPPPAAPPPTAPPPAAPPPAAPPPAAPPAADSDQESGLAVSIRRGVDEISRVISAIAAAPDMSRPIPYLGTLLPVDVGDTAVIDTLTIGSLFDLAGRFESEVATPLRDFLGEFPTATADQLVAEFDFLNPVSGFSGGIEGVRLNLESGGTVESSLAALLDPITAGENGILRAVDGDALATPLPLQYALQGLRVDLVRDASGRTAMGIPGFSIDLSPGDTLPVDFAAAVGFLSGQVSGGDLQFDLDLDFDPAGLFRTPDLDGSPLAGLIDLDSLRSISATEIAQQLRMDIGGSGLNLSLPFDFELAGFDPGSLLPEFTFGDVDPLDDQFPALDLIVPEGVGYSAESLLAFHSIDATTVLGSLQQLGSVFESWQQGGPLNVPIPLSDNVTLGDAVGLAEGYSTAVLQFLRDGEGFPSFASVQELAELIPAAGGVGPIESLRYDPETQHLEISLEFFRQGEPIEAQANLNAFAGDEDRPLASVQMVPGEQGVDNRLQINRNASLGLELAIDLSRRDDTGFRLKENVVETRSDAARLWTPMHLVMERQGLGFETDLAQQAQVQLRDGRVVDLNLGRMNANTTIDELVARGNVYVQGEQVLVMTFEDDRLVLADLTTPDGSQPAELIPGDGFFWSTFFVDDRDVDGDGRIVSEPLSATWFQDFSADVTPLVRFLDPDDAANLVESAPLRIQLADGTTETVTLPAVGTMQFDDLAAAMTITRLGQTVLRTTFSARDGRFRLQDLTEPQGDHRLTVTWDGGSQGAPVVARFIPIGVDTDRDGQLQGPRAFPRLPYDAVSPIDRSVRVERLLSDPLERSAYEEPSSITLSLRDGSSITLTAGPIDSETTLGDLMDQLVLQQGDSLRVEPLLFPDSDQLFLIDSTQGGDSFEITGIGGGLFASWFVGDPLIAPEYLSFGSVINSESLSARGFGPSRLAEFVVPPHLRGVTGPAATATLLDGSTHSLSVGLIDSSVRLQEIADRMTVIDGGQVLLRGSIRDNRIVLEDKSSPSGPDARLSIEFETPSGPTKYFLSTARGFDGRGGILEMRPFTRSASGDALSMPQRPEVLVDTESDAPAWTTVETLLERNAGQNLISSSHEADIRLRDGTLITWTIDSLSTTSIEDVVAGAKWHRDGNPSNDLIAEVTYEQGRWVLHDLTGGGSMLAIIDSTGELWPTFFGEVQDNDGDGKLVSDPLRQTALETFDGNVPMVWFADGSDPDNQGDAKLIEIALRDGTTELVSLGPIQSNLVSVLEALTVRRDGKTVVAASFENGSIRLLNRQPGGEQPFSIRMLDSSGSEWPRHFLTFGSDVNNDGAIVSTPFFPQLPDGNFPPPGDGTLPAGIRINAATRLGDYAELTGLTPLLDQPESRLVITLRDGREVALTVQNDPAMTLAEYAAQFRVEIDGETVMDAAVEPRGGIVSPLNHRFLVVDRTDSQAGEATFAIRVDPSVDPEANSRLPAMLGLTGTDAADSGSIVGPDLKPDTRNDRFRIKLTEPPVLHAEVSAIASDVHAQARLGELASVTVDNGHGSATASIDIVLNVPTGGDSISLAELLSASNDPARLITVIADADIEFGADLSADLAGLNVADPDPQPRIEFAWPDAIQTDPSPRLNFDTLAPPTITNFDELVRLKELSAEDITDLVRRLVDLVERISGEEDLLDRRLPLLNTSLGEALDTVDRVAELVDQIVSDPDATLSDLEAELEQLLGLDDDELTLSYDAPRETLRMDVHLQIAPAAPLIVPLDLDLADAGLAGLDALVDFQADGEVTLTAAANLNLSLGLDLVQLGEVDFDDAVVVYDTTGIEATAEIRGEQLQFATAIGPLGVDVGPGTVTFDRDGLFGSLSDAPATVSVSMASQAGGVIPLTALTGADFEAVFEAVAGVNLPLQFGSGGDGSQSLQIHWPDLNSFSFAQVDSIDPPSGNQVVLPDLESAIDDFQLGDGIAALAAGIEGLFGLIDDYLGEQVLGIPVPLIGDRLSDAVDFLDELKTRISAGIGVEGIAAEVARQAIFDAIGPASGLNGGAGIIVDRAGAGGSEQPDGQITVDDVGLQVPTSDSEPQEIVFRLQLAQNAIATDATIDLDVGIPGLGLDVDGDLAATIGYSMDVGFGVSQTEGVFVEFYDDEEISLDVRASVDDLFGEGRIGPLSITARTLDASELTESQRARGTARPR